MLATTPAVPVPVPVTVPVPVPVPAAETECADVTCDKLLASTLSGGAGAE